MLCVNTLGVKFWTKMTIRSYSELSRINGFEGRFHYLLLFGSLGDATFGFDRHINQGFYKSYEWRHVRDFVIARDNGCDLGVLDYEIHSDILVHHMNVMTADDIIHGEEWIINPEYLITTCIDTHNAIHYGREIPKRASYTPRFMGDTTLWGRKGPR